MLKLSFIAASLVFGLAAEGIRFEHKPAKGQKQTIQIEFHVESELKSMDVEMVGMQPERGQSAGYSEPRSNDWSMTIEDEVLEASDGEATKLLRRFKTHTWNSDDKVREGRLHERNVLFAMVDGLAKHTFVGDDGEALEMTDPEMTDKMKKQADSLPWNMDLRELLSSDAREKGVEPGDEWELPLAVFNQLRVPGGQGAMHGTRGLPGGDHEPQLEGDFKMKFIELKEHEGAQYADFTLMIEVTVEVDFTETVSQESGGLEVEGGGPSGMGQSEPESAIGSAVFSGSGKARWDIANNRWTSMEWKVDVEEEEKIVTPVDFGRGEFKMIETMVHTGEETLSYVFGE